MRIRTERNHERQLIGAQIEAETQRIIDTHWPTIYSLQGTEIANRRQFTPEEMAEHVRHFFSQVDQVIRQQAKTHHISCPIADELSLAMRQLYTVASIDSQINAVQQGKEMALSLAGGNNEAVYYDRLLTESGRLFSRTQHGVLGNDIFQHPIDRRGKNVVLVTDDVAHSGSQMAIHIDALQSIFPTTPVVASVGVITNRGRKVIEQVLRGRDQLIFQEKRPDLVELISQSQHDHRRAELLKLAWHFFRSQGQNPDDGFKATHIITPFKLPDGASNGILAKIFFSEKITHFTMFSRVRANRDFIYPGAL